MNYNEQAAALGRSMSVMEKMFKRLPSINQIISVYAVISFIIYGWTIVAFSGKVPAWSSYLTLSEILSVYSYALLTDFSESVIFLALLLILCVILPPRLMLDVFIPRGAIITICSLGALIFNLVFYTNAETTLIGNLPGWLVIFVCALTIMSLLDLLSRKIARVTSFLIWFSDQLKIFSYSFIFLSFLALIIVAIRNLD